MVSPISAGLAGIDRSLQLFQKAADAAADPDGDPTESILAAQVAKTELRVNVAVIRTADQMTGTIIDLLA